MSAIHKNQGTYSLLNMPSFDALQSVWYCDKCNPKFFFSLDVDDHKDQTGHSTFTQTRYGHDPLQR